MRRSACCPRAAIVADRLRAVLEGKCSGADAREAYPDLCDFPGLGIQGNGLRPCVCSLDGSADCSWTLID